LAAAMAARQAGRLVLTAAGPEGDLPLFKAA
jgi:hypothetical protein